ncbi:MAG: TatD family hydrolase [Phycisphaerales bacterium]|jgi:TatD DNase family protein
MIDSHCHLTFPDFELSKRPGGVAGVLATAREHAVSGCITICTTTQDAGNVLAVAEAHDNVWCSVGVHPLYSDEGPHDWSVLGKIGRHPKCVAWGELGLDNHYKEPASATQRSVLEAQLAAIEGLHREGLVKPVVLHCREAFDDLIPILRGSSLDASKFVFHCFTAGPREMRMLLDFGACVSFTGVVTYKSAKELREAAVMAPIDRIMVETDAPFLSPHPHRGKSPCEPWMVSLTAKELATLRGEAWDVFHAAINANTARFFGVA